MMIQDFPLALLAMLNTLAQSLVEWVPNAPAMFDMDAFQVAVNTAWSEGLQGRGFDGEPPQEGYTYTRQAPPQGG